MLVSGIVFDLWFLNSRVEAARFVFGVILEYLTVCFVFFHQERNSGLFFDYLEEMSGSI